MAIVVNPIFRKARSFFLQGLNTLKKKLRLSKYIKPFLYVALKSLAFYQIISYEQVCIRRWKKFVYRNELNQINGDSDCRVKNENCGC